MRWKDKTFDALINIYPGEQVDPTRRLHLRGTLVYKPPFTLHSPPTASSELGSGNGNLNLSDMLLIWVNQINARAPIAIIEMNYKYVLG